MYRLKELKYLTLLLLLGGFIAAGSLNSCREQKKQDNSEMEGEHHEGEENHDGDEHPEGEEHPEGDEQAKDTLSG